MNMENEIILERGMIRKAKGVRDVIVGCLSDRITKIIIPFGTWLRIRPDVGRDNIVNAAKEFFKDLTTEEKEYEIIIRIKEKGV